MTIIRYKKNIFKFTKVKGIRLYLIQTTDYQIRIPFLLVVIFKYSFLNSISRT